MTLLWVLYKDKSKAVLLKTVDDMSSFSFFQSQPIVEHSEKGHRASVKAHLCHIFVQHDSLAGMVIMDSEYPFWVAFALPEKNLREADTRPKVQTELDAIKIILHNTMEPLLELGEKLDGLVSKSKVLGTQSKAPNRTGAVQSCEGRWRRPLN
uniref:V-SNARE coiled-coil homology domain-containing protein n=1 Tax=Canis lupus familiaris TaxID=9615 RepID=A0A8C0QLJ2_CANLF